MRNKVSQIASVWLADFETFLELKPQHIALHCLTDVEEIFLYSPASKSWWYSCGK